MLTPGALRSVIYSLSPFRKLFVVFGIWSALLVLPWCLTGEFRPQSSSSIHNGCENGLLLECDTILQFSGADIPHTHSVYVNLSSHESGVKANCWFWNCSLSVGANTFIKQGIGIVVALVMHCWELLFSLPQPTIKWSNESSLRYWSQLSLFTEKSCHSCIHWIG